MQGEPVAVTVRFSNGGGDPNEPDYAPDVRGMAVSFHLADGSRTDISSQSLPRFPFKEVGPFVEFLRLSKPSASSALRMPLFFARHPSSIAALRVNLAVAEAAPELRRDRLLRAARLQMARRGGRRALRPLRVAPTVDLPPLEQGEARRRGRDYLREELEARLEERPVRFELEVQVAGPGDDPDDPSSVWPEERDRVDRRHPRGHRAQR